MVSIERMRNQHCVILFYTVLSRIGKCCKSRVFGSNSWVKSAAHATFFAFCSYVLLLGISVMSNYPLDFRESNEFVNRLT